jgi:precorrin-8X/cobalt-precorrin-8 methylmutase
MSYEAWEIEEQSLSTIEDRLAFPYPERKVAARVVHATADYSFAELLVFKGSPVQKGIEAILGGKDIITDVNMVRTGISPGAGKYGCRVRCFIAEESTLALAEKEGITRARAAFRLNKGELKDSIIAVGNSPTALLELAELVKRGFAPALVIAVPVGFLLAREAKEEILRLPVPCIAVKGEKGGSAVAVAIVNALIKLAEEHERQKT